MEKSEMKCLTKIAAMLITVMLLFLCVPIRNVSADDAQDLYTLTDYNSSIVTDPDGNIVRGYSYCLNYKLKTPAGNTYTRVPLSSFDEYSSLEKARLAKLVVYRDDILDSSAYPKNKVCYKLILISSQITKPVRRKLEGTPTWKNPDDPFLYSVSTEDGADIKVYVMEWSELIEINKRKLAYLSQSLNVKPEDVGEKFAREYPKLLNEKSRNRLNQRSLK